MSRQTRRGDSGWAGRNRTGGAFPTTFLGHLSRLGNARSFPHGFLESVRTMTAGIAIELSEVPFYTTHYYALFAIGLVLFIVTFAVNMAADVVLRKYQEKER